MARPEGRGLRKWRGGAPVGKIEQPEARPEASRRAPVPATETRRAHLSIPAGELAPFHALTRGLAQ
eukprot:1749226-Alexandrium_andersonii.AAC.1